MRSLLSLSVVAAALLVAGSADAAPNWGVFPGIRLGPTFPASDTLASGFLLEAHLDGTYILPGDRVGLCLGAGYATQWVNQAEGLHGTGVGLDGWTLTPSLMLSVAPRVWLEAKAGAIFGDLGEVGAFQTFSTTGLRAGGGLTVDIVQNWGADVAAHLEFMKTWADAPGAPSYDASAVTLDFTFAFFANFPEM